MRIIHGKGLRSGPRGPVLKQTVNTLLRRADAVLAFTSAAARDGGTGATLVLLQASGAGRRRPRAAERGRSAPSPCAASPSLRPTNPGAPASWP